MQVQQVSAGPKFPFFSVWNPPLEPRSSLVIVFKGRTRAALPEAARNPQAHQTPGRFHHRLQVTPGVAASLRQQPHIPAGPPGTGPLISFARSGVNVLWGPAFQTLLELAEACDIPVRWSCRTGVCHTCETALVAGRVSYRPEPIDAPADGNLLVCCCQPQGDVVIDL